MVAVEVVTKKATMVVMLIDRVAMMLVAIIIGSRITDVTAMAWEHKSFISNNVSVYRSPKLVLQGKRKYQTSELLRDFKC